MFLRKSLQTLLIAYGFTPENLNQDADCFFKNGKQVNIVDYTFNSGNDTCVNVYDKGSVFAGKFTALSVLNGDNVLLNYFLKN